MRAHACAGGGAAKPESALRGANGLGTKVADSARHESPERTMLRRFWREEEGDIYPTTSLLMSTLVIAIPLGLMLWAIYGSLCEAGRHANLIIGLF
jgi:hypothetical protein